MGACGAPRLRGEGKERWRSEPEETLPCGVCAYLCARRFAARCPHAHTHTKAQSGAKGPRDFPACEHGRVPAPPQRAAPATGARRSQSRCPALEASPQVGGVAAPHRSARASAWGASPEPAPSLPGCPGLRQSCGALLTFCRVMNKLAPLKGKGALGARTGSRSYFCAGNCSAGQKLRGRKSPGT